MSRVQLALNVSDLEAAVGFYSKLFHTEPAKRRPGYANFAIAEPPLKLVLIEGHGQPGTLNHLGIEVESRRRWPRRPVGWRRRAWPRRPRTRWPAATRVQDKVWVDAPDGEPWEIYTVLGDVEHPPASCAPTSPARMRCAVGRRRSRRPAAAESGASPPAGRAGKWTGLASRGSGRLVAGLAVTQTVSWGVLYYAFSVLLVPMQDDLGWSRSALIGGFTTAVVLSGLAAPLVGRLLDAEVTRPLITGGSLLGVAATCCGPRPAAWSPTTRPGC